MNRFRGPQFSRSRASPDTTCQKCLKKGHYSYECTAKPQERPYAARPSRTQQLLNPKLAPQLTNDAPNDLLRTKGVANEQLAKKDAERERERERARKPTREDDDYDRTISRKRPRSVSSRSSTSVSTISTNVSRSPPPRRGHSRERNRSGSRSRNGTAQSNAESGFDRKRRRSPSYSSPGSDHAEFSQQPFSAPFVEAKDRYTRRRLSSYSPVARGRRRNRSSDRDRDRSSSRVQSRRRRSRRRSRSASTARAPRTRPSRGSPHRKEPRPISRERNLQDSNGHRTPRPPHEDNAQPHNINRNGPPPQKERSLSPYSKRLALTQAMNMGYK